MQSTLDYPETEENPLQFQCSSEGASGAAGKTETKEDGAKDGAGDFQLRLGRTKRVSTKMDVNRLRNELIQFEIQHEDLSLSNGTLGGGSFGEVREGEWQNVSVAVKTIRSRVSDIKFLREVKMMSRVNHPRIVRFYGFTMSPNRIVMELVEKGSLKDRLRQGRIPLQYCRKFAIDVAQGVCYLHGQKPPIVHRDLKPENILMAEDGCRIADFGISAEVHKPDFGTRCGTNWYMAPEVMLAQQYSEKADIFSFSIVLWQMLSGLEPYSEVKQRGLNLQFDIAKKMRRPQWPASSSSSSSSSSSAEALSSLKGIVELCWQQTPSQRPSMKDVIQKLTRIKKKQQQLQQSEQSHVTAIKDDDIDSNGAQTIRSSAAANGHKPAASRNRQQQLPQDASACDDAKGSGGSNRRRGRGRSRKRKTRMSVDGEGDSDSDEDYKEEAEEEKQEEEEEEEGGDKADADPSSRHPSRKRRSTPKGGGRVGNGQRQTSGNSSSSSSNSRKARRSSSKSARRRKRGCSPRSASVKHHHSPSNADEQGSTKKEMTTIAYSKNPLKKKSSSSDSRKRGRGSVGSPHDEKDTVAAAGGAPARKNSNSISSLSHDEKSNKNKNAIRVGASTAVAAALSSSAAAAAAASSSSSSRKKIHQHNQYNPRVVVPETPWNMQREEHRVSWKCDSCGTVNSHSIVRCRKCQGRKRRTAARASALRIAKWSREGGTKNAVPSGGSVEEDVMLRSPSSSMLVDEHPESMSLTHEYDEQEDLMMAVALSLSECSNKYEKKVSSSSKKRTKK